jgi:predicted kinase
MLDSFLLIVTGLPASGKTTLARELATRYSAPLLAKDAIKEALFDVLPPCDAAGSRRLSDASFRVLAAVASELARAGASCVLDGNFRRGEHEALLQAACAGRRKIVQILCRVDETTRLARLEARSGDAHRHPGHRDAAQAGQAPSADTDAFLELPGERIQYTTPGATEQLVHALDDWLSVGRRG